MSPNTNAYDCNFHVAEIYDQVETEMNDVTLIRRLVGSQGSLKILEPFCGTGRILIPLALDGHAVHGIDQSIGMLSRASTKIQQLPSDVQARIQLSQADVLCGGWSPDFDLVILGCNCFYELALPEEQERCVMQAFQSLKPGGHLFIDNDHMEGELAPSWQDVGAIKPSLQGICSDRTTVESTRETIWIDVPRRLARFRRHTKVIFQNGDVVEQVFIQQKHPVSKGEVQGWLEKHNFIIEGIYGDYDGTSYTDVSPRAIFWATRS